MIYSLAVVYLAVGSVVCLLHPQLLRPLFGDLWRLELGAAGFALKPLIALAAFLLYCILWPIALFNAGKSEKKAQEKLNAQLERLRPFMMLHTAMNSTVKYSGGDGSSFEEAVILGGATLISGPRAACDFIERRYPGCQRGRQSLREQNGKSYDVLEFTTSDGEQRAMYFDITAHFQETNDA